MNLILPVLCHTECPTREGKIMKALLDASIELKLNHMDE